MHEVFITDIDESNSKFTAQIPSSHSYFCDGISPRNGFVDALTLLEACRQAATASAHLFWDVAENRKFVLTHWRAKFPAAARPRYGPDPVNLNLHVSLEKARHSRGDLIGGTQRVEVYLSPDKEEPVGILELDVVYLSKEAYGFLRTGLVGELPTLTSLHSLPNPEAASPAEVGFMQEENVAISCPKIEANGGRASLRSPFHNRSMFDHEQDHVPAMVLVEASRQLVCATQIAKFDFKTMLVGIEGEFSKYVELDDPVELSSSVQYNDHMNDPLVAKVEIIQVGSLVAAISLELAPHPQVSTSGGRA